MSVSVKAMVRIAGCASVALGLAACTSEQKQTTLSPYASTMARPVSPDVYPVIEGKLPAATTQMSNEDATAQQARLTSLSSARSSGRISEAEYQRRLKELQALAEHHGADTLQQIRN